VLVQMQGAQAAGERVLGLLETVPGIQDSDEVRAKLAAPNPPAGSAPDGLPDRVGTLEFRDVDFSYETGEPVLENFNLKVESGQTVALVGAISGVKNTIVNLATRFYEPTRGSILVIAKGRIIESGTPTELIAAKGHYHALHNRQSKQESDMAWREIEGSAR
jgi:ATP-binding cassette subfamily B protein